MIGMIDLIYVCDGWWYVFDYKFNCLFGYSLDFLVIVMCYSEYDLQVLIYILVLYCWLCFCLGVVYDYECDMGGICYLFCRGLDGVGNGVYVDCFLYVLVDVFDVLFVGGEQVQVQFVVCVCGVSV